ncbi:protein of unknown function [Clostridium collagenovorans DSM 3089]|uniref:DUF4352 domain-containing protein n=1 Tax=Clostridium collagenovorans DSM 3089 TaxID=1121306 RepID=A0A1M5U0H3_9CLOT|nr:DUF4352 domain-containing protein [Clostridium collagenovorans]SHH56458.1 protein of unknown function [Clostridium collagenovorans DSM 3089]
MKKTLALVIATLMTLGVVGCGEKAVEEGKTKVEEGAEKTKEGVKDTAEKVKDGAEKVGDEIKAVTFGDMKKSGHFDIKVIEATEADVIKSGDGSNDKTTENKFIIVKLEMKNNSKEAVAYETSDFMLKYMKDQKEYKNSEAADIANDREKNTNKDMNYITAGEKIDGETTKNTFVVFEVPKDVTISDSVVMSKNAGSEGKTIEFKLAK